MTGKPEITIEEALEIADRIEQRTDLSDERRERLLTVQYRLIVRLLCRALLNDPGPRFNA